MSKSKLFSGLFYSALGASILSLTACQTTPKTAEPNGTAMEIETASAEPMVAPSVNAAPASNNSKSCKAIDGAPPKPAKGADFAKNAVGKNIGRNVGRNILGTIGGAVAGPLGASVSHVAAAQVIRSEQDLKGDWNATDGAPKCGCTLTFSSGLTFKNASTRTTFSQKAVDGTEGTLAAKGCQNTLLAQANYWTLGYSFTGYDAEFKLLNGKGGTTLANLKRDGINYFSGTLSDGTPVTLWRR